MRKFLSICATLVAISAISVMAQTPDPSPLPDPDSSDPSMKLADWKTNTVQQVGDKIFTFISSTLPTNSTVSFSLIQSGHGLGYLAITFDGGSMLASGQYLNYTIAIDQTMSPSDVFSNASMDTSWSFGSTLGTTTIYEPNPDVVLTSVNGNPSAVVIIPGGLKFLTVNDTWTGGGLLTSHADAFLEVPEPSTCALLFTGLGGLLITVRRKNR